MTTVVDPDRVRNYRYRCDDRSLLSPHLRRLICVHVAQWIPLRWSPNLVSLLANGCSIATFGMLVVVFGPRDGYGPSPYASTLAALGIAGYVVLDNSDGLHARRLGLSSPLGDFIDHWLDAFSAFMIPLGILWMLHVDEPMSLAIVVLSILAFWVANWEMKETGVLTLPKLGEVEGNVLAIAVHGVAALYGRAVFREQFAGLALAHWLSAIVLLGFASATVEPLLTRVRWRAPIVGVVTSMALHVAWALLDLRSGGSGSDCVRPALIVGLVGVKHIGDVQRAHLLGLAFRPFDWALLVQGLLLLASLVVASNVAFDIYGYASGAALAVVGAKLAYQFVHTWRFVATQMDAPLLWVRKPQVTQRGSGVPG